jgi:hypothetical protein
MYVVFILCVVLSTNESNGRIKYYFKRRNPYLKEEAEADPLVVLVVSPLLRVQGLVDARMCHVKPNPLPEGTWDGVGGVDPAEGVQDLFGDVFGMYTIDGVAHVLQKEKLFLSYCPIPLRNSISRPKTPQAETILLDHASMSQQG